MAVSWSGTRIQGRAKEASPKSVTRSHLRFPPAPLPVPGLPGMRRQSDSENEGEAGGTGDP